MNKTVIIIFTIAVIAVGALTAYTFSALSHQALVPKTNPASLRPTPVSRQPGASAATTNVYHNRDLKENFYTVAVPSAWQLEPGQPAGRYAFSYLDGTSVVELMDVPDNSTLELYVLSQDEPALKRQAPGYRRLDYRKTTVNGSEAYQLTYTSMISGAAYETVRTYVSGQDRAGLMILSAKQDAFGRQTGDFDAVVNSFRWENSQ